MVLESSSTEDQLRKTKLPTIMSKKKKEKEKKERKMQFTRDWLPISMSACKGKVMWDSKIIEISLPIFFTQQNKDATDVGSNESRYKTNLRG